MDGGEIGVHRGGDHRADHLVAHLRRFFVLRGVRGGLGAFVAHLGENVLQRRFADGDPAARGLHEPVVVLDVALRHGHVRGGKCGGGPDGARQCHDHARPAKTYEAWT